MYVGFLYMLVVRQPSGSLKTAVSRKASLFSFSVSMVKEGCWLFTCCKKSSTFFAIHDGKGIVHVAFSDPKLVG